MALLFSDLTKEEQDIVLNDKSSVICPNCNNVATKNDNYCGLCGKMLNQQNGDDKKRELIYLLEQWFGLKAEK